APTTFARADVLYPDRVTSMRWAGRLAAPWSRYWLPRRNPGFGSMAAGAHVLLLLVLTGLLGLVEENDPVSAVRVADMSETVGLCLLVTMVAAALLLVPWVVGMVRSRTLHNPSSAVAGLLLQLLVAEGVLLGMVAVDLSGLWAGWVVAIGAAWA